MIKKMLFIVCLFLFIGMTFNQDNKDVLLDYSTLLFTEGVIQGIHLIESDKSILTNAQKKNIAISNVVRWFQYKLTNKQIKDKAK